MSAPSYFSPDSIMGGGERYVHELAKSMAKYHEVRVFSFAKEKKQHGDWMSVSYHIFPVKKYIQQHKLNPLQFSFMRELAWADVVHVHQACTLVSDLTALAARALRKKIFVTDHGGGASKVLNTKLPIYRLYHAAIAQSDYAREMLPAVLRKKARCIKGGINVQTFTVPETIQQKDSFLFVGRFLPHKGLAVLFSAYRKLLEMLGDKLPLLKVLGAVSDEGYYKELQAMGHGLPIEYIVDADDDAIRAAFHSAYACILPSVDRDSTGKKLTVQN